MSATSYRDAQQRAYETAALAGISRPSVASVIAERAVWEDAADVANDYRLTVEDVYTIAVAVLAGNRHRHGLTAAQAARIDREVWT